MKRQLLGCALATALLATALTPSSTTLALGNRPISSVPGSFISSGLPGKTLAAPEAMLAQTLLAITSSRFELALTEIDKVLESYPNFRLAHLIRGDLLMARARPISSIGTASDAPADRIADLRDEAMARLVRHQQERPVGKVPSYLL